ncbi:hypothetical protein TrCOL_g5688 [Triparma columacea]|nr:hypothetical protein TrCOL_g5688 [Triparma columacea]
MPLEEVPYAALNINIPPGGQDPVSNIDQQLQVSETFMQPGGHLALEEAVGLTNSLGSDASAFDSNSLATSSTTANQVTMANVLNRVSPRSTDSALLLRSLFSLRTAVSQTAATQLSGASDAMPPNSTLANALRETAHAQFNQISNTLMTDNYVHTLYQESTSGHLFLTSWPLSSDRNMTTTPSPVANPELPVTFCYQLENGEVCVTGAFSTAIAADLTGDPNANIFDLNPISVDTATAPTNNNSGAYTAPPFNTRVMAEMSATLLRTTFDQSNASPHSVIMVQSAPAIRALLAAAPPLGVTVHRTDSERLLNTFGLLMEQIDFGGAGNFGIYLLQRETRFVLVVGVPSASLATGGPVSFSQNGVIMTTFNLMQMTLALTGQPLLNDESSTYINVTRPSSSDRAMMDVLERCDPDASYSTPYQRGGRAGGQANMETHGMRMRLGGLAGGHSRVGMYIQQPRGQWLRFANLRDAYTYLGVPQRTFVDRLRRMHATNGHSMTFPTSYNFPNVTWQWRDGNGVEPEEWDWGDVFHGPLMRDGTFAGGPRRGRREVYIRRPGGQWLRFAKQRDAQTYLRVPRRTLQDRLRRMRATNGTSLTFPTSSRYPNVIWEWRDGNGVEPEEWVWGNESEEEDEHGEGGD